MLEVRSLSHRSGVTSPDRAVYIPYYLGADFRPHGRCFSVRRQRQIARDLAQPFHAKTAVRDLWVRYDKVSFRRHRFPEQQYIDISGTRREFFMPRAAQFFLDRQTLLEQLACRSGVAAPDKAVIVERLTFSPTGSVSMRRDMVIGGVRSCRTSRTMFCMCNARSPRFVPRLRITSTILIKIRLAA